MGCCWASSTMPNCAQRHAAGSASSCRCWWWRRGCRGGRPPNCYLHHAEIEPIAVPVRGPGGRVACKCTEESPGSTEKRCRVTPGGPGSPGSGKVPQRADRPLVFGLRARVKGCGKSAPRDRQRKRHGKPHREQDRIGTAHGEFRPAVRVDCLSPHVNVGLEEWSPIARTSPWGKGRVDRTRLTGPLAPDFV